MSRAKEKLCINTFANLKVVRHQKVSAITGTINSALMKAAKKRILIVENDSDMLFILGKVFNKAGYTVEMSTVGSGIVELKHTWPDLFILDNDLPTIDGIAISKFLRIHNATKKIPIIMISSYEIERKAKIAGVDQFVCKPFNLDHLLDVVARHISELDHKEYVDI